MGTMINFAVYVGIGCFLMIASAVIGVVLLNLDSDLRHAKKTEHKSMEHSIFDDVKNGGIKCHLLSNDAPVYNGRKWSLRMRKFMRKPIFKKLIPLKGDNFDGWD